MRIFKIFVVTIAAIHLGVLDAAACTAVRGFDKIAMKAAELVFRAEVLDFVVSKDRSSAHLVFKPTEGLRGWQGYRADRIEAIWESQTAGMSRQWLSSNDVIVALAAKTTPNGKQYFVIHPACGHASIAEFNLANTMAFMRVIFDLDTLTR